MVLEFFWITNIVKISVNMDDKNLKYYLSTKDPKLLLEKNLVILMMTMIALILFGLIMGICVYLKRGHLKGLF